MRQARDGDWPRAGGAVRTAQLITAREVAVESVTFRDCPMIVVDGRVAEGVDGVIPLSLFAGFLVYLDVPGRTLELEPYAGGGKADGRLLSGRVACRVGNRVLELNPVVAVDLEEMSRRHGINLAGMIGYPALADSVVTVNYQESLVRIQQK